MIAEREISVGVLKAAHDQEAGGQDQEHQGESEERRDADPCPTRLAELNRSNARETGTYLRLFGHRAL